VYSDNNGNGSLDAGDTPLVGTRVYLDANDNGTYDVSGTRTPASGTINLAIPDDQAFGITNGLAVGGLGGPVTHVSVTLKITHPVDAQLSAYLVGPDGTQVQLFASADGLHGINFTNTTFDDAAATPITSGSAPYSGMYRPDQALAAFNGKNANGTWVLEVADTSLNRTGSFVSWSLNVASGPEASTLTAADGSYTLNGLSPAAYTVRVIAPGTLATGSGSATINIHANSGMADFFQMPTTFTASGANDQFYLWQDANNYLIGKGVSAANPVYELPQALVTSLAFNLTSAGSKLYVDFAGGAPLPAGNVTINGGGLTTSELSVLGAGSGITTLNMTDTQLDPGTGGMLLYTNLGTLSLGNASVYYHGNLGTLQILNVNAGALFYWS
jgi:subtilisin-like proprotein convertase family protein